MGTGTERNANSTLGENPTGVGMSQKVWNGMGENVNLMDGNVREWEREV